MKHDVAVIGAGAFGAWVALRLRLAGCSVVLFDAYGSGHSRASSGGESRVIRMGYGPDEHYTQWSIRSLEQWKDLFRQIGQPLFHQTGVLWIASENDPYVVETRRVLTRHGVPHEVMAGDELRRLYPQIRFDDNAWAMLEPGSGMVLARRAVQAVAGDAQRLGVDYRMEGVAVNGGEVRTQGGERIGAGTFVFACGPWLPKVFPALLGRRIHPTRQEVLFFGAASGDRRFAHPNLPVCADRLDDRKPYCLPDVENRGFKVALDEHGPLFDPDQGDRSVSADGIAQVRNWLSRRFPDMVDAPVVETRVCQYENTSNGNFLIDRHPDFANIWMVGGGSGHGFKHGPAVGEYAAGLILNGGSPDPRFSLSTKGEVRKREVF
ncbi:MAG: FAD-dependent oxidoreductase [Bryobacteraceae bacterium]